MNESPSFESVLKQQFQKKGVAVSPQVEAFLEQLQGLHLLFETHDYQLIDDFGKVDKLKHIVLSRHQKYLFAEETTIHGLEYQQKWFKEMKYDYCFQLMGSIFYDNNTLLDLLLLQKQDITSLSAQQKASILNLCEKKGESYLLKLGNQLVDK